MPIHVEQRSRITTKGQTTVPVAVRQALGVTGGDEIAFVVDDTGVTVRRVDAGDDDPVIGAFLGFLAREMASDPAMVTAFPPGLAQRMADLTHGVDADPDAPIDGPVSI